LSPPSIGSKVRAVCVAAAVACAALTSSPAHAQSERCQAGDRECGRAAFASATAAFDRGDYREALRWFETARSAGPHPIITFNVALCLNQLGKPTQAKRELRALLDDPGTPSELRQRASDELSRVVASLAHISLETQAKSSYTIELDGQKAESQGELEVDPGEHRLRVSTPSTTVFEQNVKLAPGERLRLRVTEQARAIDVVVVPQRERAPAIARSKAPLPPAVFYAAASASAVLAGVTLWSGLDVNSAYDDYKHDLPNLTQREADERVDDGHARERRTNILLGATALSVAATVAIGVFWADLSGGKRAPSVGVSGEGVRFRTRF
jgi:Tfp pilus assembly protein PilF